MKKLLIILCLIFLALPVLAEYKPIPPERSAEYKAEIEQFVKTNESYFRSQMDKEVDKARKIYSSFYRNKKNKNIYIEELENSIRIVDTEEFYFYRELISITNNYINIEEDLPQTDWIGDYINLLEPYLKNNNIRVRNKIDSISFYAYKKNNIIKRYIYKINNF